MKFNSLAALISIIIVFSVPVNKAVSIPSTSFLLIAQADKKLNKAIQSIKEKHGGRIISTKTVTINGQRIYKIKMLLPSGKVRTFKVSAQ